MGVMDEDGACSATPMTLEGCSRLDLRDPRRSLETSDRPGVIAMFCSYGSDVPNV